METTINGYYSFIKLSLFFVWYEVRKSLQNTHNRVLIRIALNDEICIRNTRSIRLVDQISIL